MKRFAFTAVAGSVLGAVAAAEPYIEPDMPGLVQHVRINVLSRWLSRDALPIPTCANETFAAGEVVDDPLMWPYSGWLRLQKHMVEAYGDVSSDRAARERRYRAQALSYGGNETYTLTQNYTTFTQCAADVSDNFSASAFAGFCHCLDQVKPDLACSWQSALVTKTVCLDEMKKRLVERKADYCSRLVSPHYGVSIGDRCAGWVAGNVESLNLDTYKLNDGVGSPDVVLPATYEREIRTYYLLHKALERLSMYTEAYDLCQDADDSMDLETVAQVFEPLPTWVTKKMWWLGASRRSEATGHSKLPFAVLASRTGCYDRDNQCSAIGSDEESLVVLFRDARNTYEAHLQATIEAGRKLVASANGAVVHAGYDSLARQIVPGVYTYVQNWLAKKPRLQPKITYAGYGLLGSGAAAITGHDIAQMVRETPEGIPIQHDVITFGSGRVGNAAFNEQLAQLCNVRTIAAAENSFVEYPCERPRSCADHYPVVTGDADGVVIADFVNLPGRVTPSVDPKMSAEFPRFNLPAAAACAVPCWMSQTACVDDVDNKCYRETGCSVLLEE